MSTDIPMEEGNIQQVRPILGRQLVISRRTCSSMVEESGGWGTRSFGEQRSLGKAQAPFVFSCATHSARLRQAIQRTNASPDVCAFYFPSVWLLPAEELVNAYLPRTNSCVLRRGSRRGWLGLDFQFPSPEKFTKSLGGVWLEFC